MANNGFNLDDQLMRDYPEFQSINGLRDDAAKPAYTVSAVYVNLNTIEACFGHIRRKKPTISFEYLINFVGECLADLPNESLYERFKTEQSARLESLMEKTATAIGKKERGPNGVYV